MAKPSQHCWVQHVGACVATLLRGVATCCMLLAQIWEWSNFPCNICGCCMMLRSFGQVPISFPEPTCLLVSTKTWSSCIINFQNYDDWLLNLSNCSCIISLRTQTYVWLSVGFAEINCFQRNQVTAENTSAFTGSCVNYQSKICL